MKNREIIVAIYTHLAGWESNLNSLIFNVCDRDISATLLDNGTAIEVHDANTKEFILCIYDDGHVQFSDAEWLDYMEV